MAKPRKTKDPHIQLFHEVIEGMAFAKLKPTEWQFIMVLWRLTYGRKNMKGQDGQWTPWVNAEFHRRTGLAREVISRTKANLLKKRVIKKKKGMIGFNKHFDKWTKQSILTKQSVLTKQSIDRSDHKLLTEQSTTIDQTVNKKAPKVKSSEEVQRLKKERKKEIYNESGYSKEFLVFWERYPKKNDNKKAAMKAWEKHFTKNQSFTLEEILAVLEVDIKGVFKDASENKYLPGAGPWLNRERWTEVAEEKKKSKGWNYADRVALSTAVSDLHYEEMKVGVPDVKVGYSQAEVQRRINTYKNRIAFLKQKKENA
jgi:hypothetical protein